MNQDELLEEDIINDKLCIMVNTKVDDDKKVRIQLPQVATSSSRKSYRKYGPALKTFIPIRPCSRSNKTHPSDSAGLFSTITYSWLTTLIWKSFRKPPTSEDLWTSSEYDEAQVNYVRFLRLWKKETKDCGLKDASLWRVALRFVSTRLILSIICTVICSGAMFVSSAIIVHHLLAFVSIENGVLGAGFVIVSLLLTVEVTRACMLTCVFTINYRSALRMRAAILMLVFQKVLKMSPTSAGGGATVGELITMCSNDGDRIFDANRVGSLAVISPIIFISGTFYICYLFGPVGLIGSIIFLAMMPIQGILVRVMHRLRQKAIKETELRVKKINEILSSMKLIKMYSWENSFTKVVQSIRDKELAALKVSAIFQSINITLAYFIPLLASVMMIATYVLLGNNLSPQTAFTSLAVFATMSNGLKFLPLTVKSLVDVNVSFKRLKALLAMDSLENYVAYKIDISNAIEIENASFYWSSPLHVYDDVELKLQETTNESAEGKLLRHEEDPKSTHAPVLKNVNISIGKGCLVGVYGAVGSGKSSLLSSILGELQIDEGTVSVSGSIAFSGQTAWLMNATIRENIVFGSVFDKAKYDDVVRACELLRDFEILTSGDLTEIGERGINMSGGQKQRISLARALYSDRDIFLLDDPLSAVDIHVGKSIFAEVILNRLKKFGKTVVLVTHQVQYLPYCDRVFKVENHVVNESLTIGKDLLETSETSLDKVPDYLSDEDINSLKQCLSSSSSASVEKKIASLEEQDLIAQGKIITDEERRSGIPMSTYYTYISAGGGLVVGIIVSFLYILNVGTQQFGNFWLSYWLKQGSGYTAFAKDSEFNNSLNYTTISYNGVNATLAQNSQDTTTTTFSVPSAISLNDILLNPKFHFYVTIYGLSVIFMLVVSVVRGYIFVSMCIRASRVLHHSLFNAILNGTMTFFDTTPIGRIINRFQKDIDEQDVVLPAILEIFLFNFTMLFIAAGIISFVFPNFMIVFLIVFPIFIIIYTLFKPSAREMRRLDALSRSPWFSLISTAVTGLDTIRAYNQQSNFVKQFCELLNNNGVPFYLFACVNRWLAIRLDLLTITTCISTALFVILNKDVVSPAYAGLAISTSFLMNGMLQFTVRLLIESEARFVGVDRIKHYIDSTPQENLQHSIEPDEKWPKNGSVVFQDVEMRYREGLPLVLKKLALEIKACEKIGVVGRTGSGKSSLAVALFRLVELSGGRILIDGVDVSKISLHTLRSKLSVIPQDPVLFSGSVRYNLDPFNVYTDSEVWCALEQAHVKTCISKLPQQLESEVLESGSNFSVGERQLICLARALLRKSKILILDEATAAVDRETEKIVHQVIENTFSDCTVITIAHRLHSVTSSDRVIVLDDGEVVEFDSPAVLLENKESAFYKMMSKLEEALSDST